MADIEKTWAASPSRRKALTRLTGFIAASANVTTLDPALDPGEIVTTLREGVNIDSVLSNSFGFGGTNATLVMSKYLA